jgi:hypothetical protein
MIVLAVSIIIEIVFMVMEATIATATIIIALKSPILKIFERNPKRFEESGNRKERSAGPY